MFVFFDAADHPLFLRDDAESATWSVDQLSLQATFPYKAGKEIERGMRVGFRFDDSWAVFEVRKAKVYEPDHYQEITAEHIAVAELTDSVYQGADVQNQTAQATLAPMLVGTGWAIGTVTDSTLSSVDVGLSNVWNHARNIEKNWNVIVTPRVEVGPSGITGRYLDIAPNEGTWRGVRLSLERNADDMGVVWDDTDVKTALYGYGAETDGVKLTFADAVWSATDDHPAKPQGQTYLEDPEAKALYGRNGVNRWGYYQNSAIKDAATLLQKTWDTLKTLNAPRITINCTVTDLKRLGYNDQQIRLHDKVVVDIKPQNKTIVLDVIKLDIDLLNPTATRPTIGAYIPNIIYIDRQTSARARGGYGGGAGPDDAENQIYEFETLIDANGEAIRLEATQRAIVDGQLSTDIAANASAITLSATKIQSLVVGTGAQINADGTLVTDSDGNPVFTTTGAGLYSKIEQNKSSITQIVSAVGEDGEVTTASIVTAINSQGQGAVTIHGDLIDLDGYVTAISLAANSSISADILTANDILYAHSAYIDYGGTYSAVPCNADLEDANVTTGLSLTDNGDGTYTLAWTDWDGTAHSETFNRAAGTITIAAPSAATIGADAEVTLTSVTATASDGTVSTAANLALTIETFSPGGTAKPCVRAKLGGSLVAQIDCDNIKTLGYNSGWGDCYSDISMSGTTTIDPGGSTTIYARAKPTPGGTTGNASSRTVTARNYANNISLTPVRGSNGTSTGSWQGPLYRRTGGSGTATDPYTYVQVGVATTYHYSSAGSIGTAQKTVYYQ